MSTTSNNNDVIIITTRTADDHHDALINQALDLIMDAITPVTEWDDEPTHEPMNISTGVFNEWGYYGRGDDTQHRPNNMARSYANNKARR